MGKKDEEAFQKWAQEYEEALPENLKNSWKALINADEARTPLVGALLMQRDYTSKTQEVAKARQSLEDAQRAFEEQKTGWASQAQNWWTTANTEYQQAQARALAAEQHLASLGVTAPQAANPSPNGGSRFVAKEEYDALQRRISEIDSGMLNYSNTLARLLFRAQKEGYDFDPDKVLEYASRNRVPLTAAFEDLTRDQREERAKAALDKQLAEAREQGKREALSKLPSPDAVGHPSPSTESLFSGKSLADDRTRQEEALKVFLDEQAKAASIPA